MPRFAALVLFLSLAACGTKGSLELPAGPAPTPLLGQSQATPTVPADVSTDTKATQK